MLGCILQAKRYVDILKKAEWWYDGRLWHVSGGHWDLVVALYQIHLAEHSAAMELGCRVLHVGQWVLVWRGGQVEAAVVTAWPPAAVLLFDHVERGGPGAV